MSPAADLSASLWPPGSPNNYPGHPGMTYIVVQLHTELLHPPFSICEKGLLSDGRSPFSLHFMHHI